MHCATIYEYARNGINQMWILKNSTKKLAYLKEQNFSQINSIKPYDFFTLYTTIPHEKLKSRLSDIIDNCFFNKNERRKYSYLVISHQKRYCIIYHCDSTHKYSEVDIK
jgi:mRNA-degrading endonuclease RelE of RelBE toxin-antitoxin system